MVKALVIMLVVTIVACSANGDDARESATTEAAGTLTPGAGSSGGLPPTTIHLLLSSGAHAGSYEVDAKAVTCSHGLAGAKAWGNQFSEDGAKPSSVQLIVPDAKAAATGTSEFLFTASFGQLLSGTHYEINRTNGREDGEGTATLTDRGSGATVKIVGTTTDGVGIDATIECRQVYRLGT